MEAMFGLCCSMVYVCMNRSMCAWMHLCVYVVEYVHVKVDLHVYAYVHWGVWGAGPLRQIQQNWQTIKEPMQTAYVHRGGLGGWAP